MTIALHIFGQVVLWGVVGVLIIAAGLVGAFIWSNDRNHRQLSQGDR